MWLELDVSARIADEDGVEGSPVGARRVWDAVNRGREVCLVAARLDEPHSRYMVFTSLHRPQSSVESEEKYPALRIVLFIWKSLVVLFAIATIVMTYLVWHMPDRNHIAFGLMTVLTGAMICLFQWANVELVEVLLDIEENTRRTADRGSS